MTFFHFVNCVVLAYAPYFIAYKYSNLSDYTSVWKCVQAGLIYFITQFLKMMAVATFFPASASEADTETFLTLVYFIICIFNIFFFLGINQE